MNLAAGKTINVTAPDSVNLVTASDMTIMAKKESAKIGISTLSKDASIDISANGEKSKINIQSKGDVSLSGEQVNISGFVPSLAVGSITAGSVSVGGKPLERYYTYSEETGELWYWGYPMTEDEAIEWANAQA